MEGKNKSSKLGKIKNLLKKEAFYVVLFICICVLGTAIAISAKMAQNRQEQLATEKAESTEVNVNENMENAEQVKKEEVKKESTTKSNNNSKAVSNTTQTIEFKNPLDGEVLRKFNKKVVRIDSETFRTINGIDIKAKSGAEVKASAEGVVDEVGTSADMGSYVLIKHANGYKSIYGNLEKNSSVKKGDKIKVGDLIGKVGASCTIAPMNQEGEYLRFVIKDSNNKNIDPLTYKTITLK